MYLVTGATGNVGRNVTAQLLERGAAVRVFTRDAAKVSQFAGRVEVAIGDFGTPESFARALDGVEGVFLMNGGTSGAAFEPLVDELKKHGRPRVVFLSTILAGRPGFHIGQIHKAREEAILAGGLDGRFVRPGGFMSNALQWAGTIRSQGMVYNPMGEGRSAPIAPEDIAAVVVRSLITERPEEKVFEVTGGALLSVPEQVEILAEVLGRAIRCVDIPVQAAVQGMVQAGLPEALAGGVGESFQAVRDGHGAMLLDTVQRVTGRPPTAFAAWARANAARFA
ncbi:MAG: NAD(P)H-binding protein [Acidobacteria bacterium]|nr:NAD(P)H-binding protein [Acidobacteriota bacterium]